MFPRCLLGRWSRGRWFARLRDALFKRFEDVYYWSTLFRRLRFDDLLPRNFGRDEGVQLLAVGVPILLRLKRRSQALDQFRRKLKLTLGNRRDVGTVFVFPVDFAF